MEIREGIKYKYQPGKTATVVKNPDKKDAYYAKFYNGGISVDNTSKQWITFFKRKDIKLIEYPYKIGDWVYFLGTNKIFCSSFWEIGKIQQVTRIDHDTLWFDNTSSSNRTDQFRPCFKEEMPKTKKKVVKENYDYLIPILTKLNTT